MNFFEYCLPIIVEKDNEKLFIKLNSASTFDHFFDIYLNKLFVLILSDVN